MAWLALLIHAALILAMAPALDGLLARAASAWQRQPGPPLAKPWHNLVRQWRKPALQPAGTSFLFAAAPPVAMGATAAAALLVPSFTLGMGTSAAADLIVIAGLLALSRLLPALAAYDTGAARAAFDGTQVAAARLPAEPVLLLAALVIMLMSGSTNLDTATARDGLPGLRLPGLLAGLALLAAIAHEAPMPALFSGRHQALITAANQLRRVAVLSLAATIGLPFGLAAAGAGIEAWIVGAACWVLKLAILGLVSTALGQHRAVLPAAVLLALIAAVIVGVQGST